MLYEIFPVAQESGGLAARERYRHQPRNGSILVEWFRHSVRLRNPTKTGAADAILFELAMAPGRGVVKINAEMHYLWCAIDHEEKLLYQTGKIFHHSSPLFTV